MHYSSKAIENGDSSKDKKIMLFKYTDMDFIESCITNGVYASKIDAVNDPFESEGVMYPHIYRICCMTNSPKKMLLWAYYTNHRGCCVEYDVSSIDTTLLRPVNYVDTFTPHANMTLEEVFLSLYRKGKEWKHENEFRAVYFARKNDKSIWKIDGDNIYLKAAVKSVTFGLFADRDLPRYKRALETLLNYRIQGKKCRLKNNKYALEEDRQFDLEIELEKVNDSLKKYYDNNSLSQSTINESKTSATNSDSQDIDSKIGRIIPVQAKSIDIIQSGITRFADHRLGNDDAIEETQNQKINIPKGMFDYTVGISDLLSQELFRTLIHISLSVIPVSADLIGRESNIIAVRNLIEQHSPVSIYAEGGVGKTALAQRIINDVKKEIECRESQFDHVAWISSTGNLKNDLLTLFIPGIESEESFNEKFLLACSFLQQNSTFLVIDNIIDPLSVEDINTLRTISGKTKILITSRIELKGFHQYLLKALDERDAITLFYKYYLNDRNVPTIDDREDTVFVERIVHSASCNALLIELIAKWAYQKHIARLDLLWYTLEKEVFQTNSEFGIIPAHIPHHKDSALYERDRKLYEQISTLYRIARLDSAKQEIVRFFVAFPAETIIFTDVFKWAGFKETDLEYLTDSGWIEKAEKGYLIKAIVNMSVKLQQIEFDIEKYENLIKELSKTDQYMPRNMEYSKTRERIVIPDTVCTLLMEKGSQNKETALLLNNVASVFCAQGDYNKALKYFEGALAIREKVLGTEHPETAATYSNMGDVYQYQGEYARALGFYEMALIIKKKVLDQDDSSIATTYNNIAFVYIKMGDYVKALEYYDKALAIQEKVSGFVPTDAATTYNNIGFVHGYLGDYAKAMECYEKACVIWEKVLGIDHPDTARTYNNMAYVYSHQGEFTKALEYYTKAQIIREKILGKKHPDTATTYNNMGLVFCAQGNYEKALEYFKTALEIYEKTLGLEHPDTASTYNNIGNVYKHQGYYAKALEYYEKSRLIREKVLRPYHPDIAKTYYNLGNLFNELYNYTDSKEYCQKAYDIFLKVLGDKHPNTKDAKKLLEEVNKKMDK